MVSIRDVARVSHSASVLGSPDLRDASIAVARELAPAGASREDVARIAAALIVQGAGGNPEEHGLPALPDDLRERAQRMHRERALGSMTPADLAAHLEADLAALAAARQTIDNASKHAIRAGYRLAENELDTAVGQMADELIALRATVAESSPATSGAGRRIKG